MDVKTISNPRVSGASGSLRSIGVVGCGLMGSGIAEVAALAGFDVVVVKATAGSLDHAIARVEGSLDRSVAKGT
ncbi:MAG TPA: 3-hydroxyacyl-CoA dehydrogenase NAD-binding domain-containing protein, partial [Polyangiaceae bacterium]